MDMEELQQEAAIRAEAAKALTTMIERFSGQDGELQAIVDKINGTTTDSPDMFGNTPKAKALKAAVQCGQPEVFRAIMDSCHPTQDDKDRFWKTFLVHASSTPVALLNVILPRFKDELNQRPKDNAGLPLSYAIEHYICGYGPKEFVIIMLELGADPLLKPNDAHRKPHDILQSRVASPYQMISSYIDQGIPKHKIIKEGLSEPCMERCREIKEIFDRAIAAQRQSSWASDVQQKGQAGFGDRFA